LEDDTLIQEVSLSIKSEKRRRQLSSLNREILLILIKY